MNAPALRVVPDSTAPMASMNTPVQVGKMQTRVGLLHYSLFTSCSKTITIILSNTAALFTVDVIAPMASMNTPVQVGKMQTIVGLLHYSLLTSC